MNIRSITAIAGMMLFLLAQCLATLKGAETWKLTDGTQMIGDYVSVEFSEIDRAVYIVIRTSSGQFAKLNSSRLSPESRTIVHDKAKLVAKTLEAYCSRTIEAGTLPAVERTALEELKTACIKVQKTESLSGKELAFLHTSQDLLLTIFKNGLPSPPSQETARLAVGPSDRSRNDGRVSVPASPAEFKSWIQKADTIISDHRLRRAMNELDAFKEQPNLSSYIRRAELLRNVLREQARVCRNVTEFIMVNPPVHDPDCLSLAISSYKTLESMCEHLASIQESLRQMVSEVKQAQEDGDEDKAERLASKATELDESRVPIMNVYVDQLQNYRSEMKRVMKELPRSRHSENETLLEQFVDRVGKNFGFEIAVESQRTPVAVSYSRSGGASLTIGGRIQTPSGTLPIGAEVEINKDRQRRKLYLQADSGTMIAFPLGEERVDLSFPVTRWKLDHLGLDVVLRFRNE